MNNRCDIDDVISVINKANSIGIFAHITPDGDAIVSSLGLYLGLKQLNKNVEVIADKYSRCFNFLPSILDVKSLDGGNYDLVIALDCASEDRVFNPGGSFSRGKETLSIDHHASNTYFAKYNYVEERSPSVAKTLVKIFDRLGIEINVDIGTCLMAGIITDSGGFRYDLVDNETFSFAARMLDVGVNISDIYYRVLGLTTKSQFELSRIASSRLKFYNDARLAITYITLEDLKKVNAELGDHEGIVNVGRNIEGVEVSILLREDSEGIYKVALRSKDYVNVSEIAKVFNGGGHVRAAGCIFNCSLGEAMDKLIEEVNKRL